MATKRTISQKVKLGYDGLFRVKKLVMKIAEFYEGRGYDMTETKYNEVVKADHKELKLEMEAEKKEKPKYVKYIVEIEIDAKNFQEVLVKKGDSEDKYDSATISIEQKGIIHSDIEDAWEGKPIRRLFRSLYEKFIIGDVMKDHEATCLKDMQDLNIMIKNHLNLYSSGKEIG